MAYYFNKGITSDAQTTVLAPNGPAVTDAAEDAVAHGGRKPFEYIAALLSYVLGIHLAAFAAIAGSLLGAAAGYATGSGLATVYKFLHELTTGPGPHAHFDYELGNLIEATVILAASFAAAFAFCTVLLRILVYKNQIQSIVILEMVALLGVIVIAGDARSTLQYTEFFAGSGCIFAVVLIVLKWPHWAYLNSAKL